MMVVNPRAWFGGVLKVVTNITFLSIALVGAALIREKEHGTLEHLLVMPVTSFEIMVSKLWSMGLVIFVMALFALTVLLPLQFLSGGITPRESMPALIRYIMYLSPETHFVIISQAVLFRGVGLSIIWPNLLWLLAIGGSFFLYSQSYFKKMLSRM